jgi:hypothetical protein
VGAEGYGGGGGGQRGKLELYRRQVVESRVKPMAIIGVFDELSDG